MPREEIRRERRPVVMFPWKETHQEIVRQRHADRLRAARREQLASVLTAESERSPIVRLRRLIEGSLLAPMRRREADVREPARAA